MGVWIEFDSEQKDKVRRISAQKSLNMPQIVVAPSIDKARERLEFGDISHTQGSNYDFDALSSDALQQAKLYSRWGQRPGTYLLDDFGNLLEYLFAEEHDASSKYRQAARQTDVRVEPPETKIDVVQQIWEEVLPHRALKISGNRIDTALSEDPNVIYAPTDMSDGERVIFYLIGQALSAPENGIIVVDEPELHLHRSIQATLWDKIEAQRPDCLFVYLTHDLDFAASRVAATKICLKSYDGQGWDWFIVPENNEIPEEVFLEILGSRKPIIFAEGDKGGWDYYLYQKVYPGFTIAPCGGADNVIHATRSFASLEALHRHDCYGIIDRDYRDEDEVEWLRARDVFVLDYSEIENLLLAEEVLRTVAKHLARGGEFSVLLEEVKDIVFKQMDHNREQLVSSITAAKIERGLTKNFNAKAKGKAALQAALGNVTSIDAGTLYEDTAADVEAIINSRDYARALELYNDKGLVSQVSVVFGFKPVELAEYIKRRVSSGNGDDLIEAFRSHAPLIQAS